MASRWPSGLPESFAVSILKWAGSEVVMLMDLREHSRYASFDAKRSAILQKVNER